MNLQTREVQANSAHSMDVLRRPTEKKILWQETDQINCADGLGTAYRS